jgi:hypothetical protein
MLQSGHQNDSPTHGLEENHTLITHDYGLMPVKPVLDGEPMYDDTPDAVWMKRSIDGTRGDVEVMRRKAYWAVFSGAFGHTYGHNDLYNFFVPAYPGQVRGFAEGGPGQQGDWREALFAPAAGQMRHLRALMESRPFLTRIPDQSLLLSGAGEGLRHVRATRDAEGTYALLYLPAAGQTVTVDTGRLSGKRLKAWWYNPRTGNAMAIENEFSVGGQLEFTAPAEESDWVLVLDDAGKHYTEPGRRAPR